MEFTIETIGIIFVGCVASSVVSVMLNDFKKNKHKFQIKEIWDYVLPAFFLSALVMCAVLIVYAIVTLIIGFFIAIT